LNNSLFIAETLISPCVNLNIDQGEFNISGRLLTTTPESFFKPVLDWLDRQTPQNKVEFHFEIICSDVNCAKRLLFVLYKLRNWVKAGAKVRVHWHYEFHNYDMREIGEDFATMIYEVPFHFSEKKAA